MTFTPLKVGKGRKKIGNSLCVPGIFRFRLGQSERFTILGETLPGQFLDTRLRDFLRLDHICKNLVEHHPDDISLRFNNAEWEGYPLFADAYIDRIAHLPEEDQIANIFMELSALGIAQPLSSNILDFIKALPAQAKPRGRKAAAPRKKAAAKKEEEK